MDFVTFGVSDPDLNFEQNDCVQEWIKNWVGWLGSQSDVYHFDPFFLGSTSIHCAVCIHNDNHNDKY